MSGETQINTDDVKALVIMSDFKKKTIEAGFKPLAAIVYKSG